MYTSKLNLKLAALTGIILLASLSCSKENKNQKFAVEAPADTVSPSCGAIDMSPSDSLFSNIVVNFEVIPPNGVTFENLQWTITKKSKVIHTSTNQTVSRAFNNAGEGSGTYVTTVKFNKPDGNACELERSFQILKDNTCVKPNAISGPNIGYINEETSPFLVGGEPCFKGSVNWDMDNNGTNEHTTQLGQFVTHKYDQVGVYTVKAIVIDAVEDEAIYLTKEIDIRNKSCLNPFTNAVVAHGDSVEFAKASTQCGSKPCERNQRVCENGVFSSENGLGTYTLDPAQCKLSDPCPALYAWEASEYGQCTGACGSSNGTKPITNYICKKTYDGSTTTAPDSECAGIGAKPSGQTVSCQVNAQDQNLNCMSCGDVPHGSSVTKWAQGNSCGTACTSQSRTCNDGTLPAFDTNFIHATQASCPVVACPPVYTYSWVTGEYGACSAVACGTQGVKTRSVVCVRNDGAAVSDSFCNSEKPSTTIACSAPACPPTNVMKGNTCHAFAGTSIIWTDSKTGKTCSGSLFGNLMAGDYMQIGGTEYNTSTNEVIPWDKAKFRGTAKVICDDKTVNNMGMIQFAAEGTCATTEPTFITAPALNSATPNECATSPVVQQDFGIGNGNGACADYVQSSGGDMPIKGFFVQTGARKYPKMGEFVQTTAHILEEGKGYIHSSGNLKITYKGETKTLNVGCGNSDVVAPTNSSCMNTGSVTIKGVTFTMGVAGRNTIDPQSYVPKYIGGFPNQAGTAVWSQKTCGVATLRSSLDHLPPPCTK